MGNISRQLFLFVIVITGLLNGCAFVNVPLLSPAGPLAEQVLQMPVSLGQTNSVSGLKSALDQPEFVTAIGLVKFGSFKTRNREGKPSLAQGIKGVFGRLLQRP